VEPAQDPAQELHPAAQPATSDLFYVVFRLHRAMSRAFETVALRHGLTQPELLACLVLVEGRPLSNAQLAQRTFVTAQASPAALDVLEERILANHSAEEHRPLPPSLLRAAETLAGGYFGSEAAESEALELRGKFKGTSPG